MIGLGVALPKTSGHEMAIAFMNLLQLWLPT